MDEAEFHADLSADPGPTLGEMVRAARVNWTRQSLRTLSRETGISSGQLSRIENGQTCKPAIRTLQVLAPALNLGLPLLLALAGHLDASSARPEFRTLVRRARAQLVSDYGDEGAYADDLAERVGAMSTATDVRVLAFELGTLPFDSVGTPPEVDGQAPSGTPDRSMMRELLAAWSEMSPDRRWRLLLTAKDFAAVAAKDEPSTEDPR